MSDSTSASYIPYTELVDRLTRLLCQAGASERVASIIAANCGGCERDGALSHGVFRMPGYLSSLRSGGVDGRAKPQIETVSDAFIRVDAGNGFAQVALADAMEATLESVQRVGVALVAIRRAHHFSALWPDVEGFAERGYLAFTAVTGGAPQARVPGSQGPVLGTNPMAFASPGEDGGLFVWDLATSAMSRGDVMIARQEGRTVSAGVGVDRNGNPTQDPAEIVEFGGLLPFGGHKGALLMMTVELLASAMTGSNFSFEAVREKPEGAETSQTGQFLLVVDPDAGDRQQYAARAAHLLQTLRNSGMTRMPGERRYRHRERALQRGIAVTDNIRALLQ